MLHSADRYLDNLLVASSKVRQSNKNAGKGLVHSHIGNGVDRDLFTENMRLASGISEARRNQEREEEG
jgi:hypothetical protein